MGREIRRVPANWEHPKTFGINYRKKCMEPQFVPLFDRDYAAECKEWYDKCANFVPRKGVDFFHEYSGNPPDKEKYVSYNVNGDLPWFQMYETVSEGTPVTPAFATQEELIEYLVAHGDFWDQMDAEVEGGSSGWRRDRAERIVKETGWAPSMVLTPEGLITPKEGA